MAEDNGLNKILKKVYATELDLIEDVQDLSMRRQRFFMVLKDRLWIRHSTAIRVAIVAFCLAVVSAAVYYYNFFTMNVYRAYQEKANVEAQLQRRGDLIPNLVASAGSYLVYEKNIFGHIAEVRGAVAGMKSLEQSMQKIGIQDRSVLSKFQAVAEAYPALKASEAYTTLMKELSDTETKLAESRIKYNEISNYHNSRLKLFPAVIFNTLLFRFKPLPIFEASNVAAPNVQQKPLPDVMRPPAPETRQQPLPDPGKAAAPDVQPRHE
jgi:LemA protein